jgi:dipeptidyl aminopeptidase/acylaminoacyl peptidase
MKKWFSAAFAAVGLCASNMALAQAAAPAPAAKPKIIPTELLAKMPLISGPRLSPDGRKLLAMIANDGKPMLGLRFIDSAELRSFGLPKGFEVVSYSWAGDGRVLISLGKTTPFFDDEAYMTRLVTYDLATRKTAFIGKREQGLKGDDILYVDPAGAWLLLSIQKTVFDWPSVYRVDLATGEMKEVVAPRDGIMGWYADGKGVVRAGLGFDKPRDRWTMVYRGPAGGNFRKVSNERGDNVPLGDLRFAPDTDRGFIVSEGDNGRDAVFEYDFATLTKGKLVFAAPENDVSRFLLSPDGKTVEAAYYTDVRDRVHWFDPVMKELQAAVDQSVGAREAWVVSTSRDKEAMVVLVTSANDPGSIYFYQPAAGRMDRLAQINDGLRGYPLAPAKPVSYKARDGLTIHGYLTLPPSRPAKGLPLIVMPHGGPYGIRDAGDYDPEVQLLANRGYAVLQPNYRGSGSYGREFEDKGAGQWGRAMQDDLDDGMDWLVKDGIVDAKRVCIVGSSYGGYAAMWGATRNPERYRCAASFAGVSDVQKQLKYSRSFFTSASKAREFRDRVRGDEQFRLADISPSGRVQDLKVPILLTHGDEDQRVPLKQSALYAAALAKAGKTHEYKVYAGEGHGLSDPANSKDYYDRLEAFLKKYNPAD